MLKVGKVKKIVYNCFFFLGNEFERLRLGPKKAPSPAWKSFTFL